MLDANLCAIKRKAKLNAMDWTLLQKFDGYESRIVHDNQGYVFNSENVEQRLDQIKDHLDKGLITEEEAMKARKSVLIDL